MSNRNEIKSLAKLAKQRLKSGFWEECRENVNESLTRAKEEGENTSNVIRYYKSEVARVISNKNEELELFYVKVKNILDEYGDIPYEWELIDRSDRKLCPELAIYISGRGAGPLAYYVGGFREDYFWCNSQMQIFYRQ